MLVFVGGNQQNLLLIKYDLWTLRTYHSTNHQQPRSPHPSNGPRLGSWITSWHCWDATSEVNLQETNTSHHGWGSSENHRLKHTDSEWGYMWVPKKVKNKQNKKNTSLKNRRTYVKKHLLIQAFPPCFRNHILCYPHGTARLVKHLEVMEKNKKLRSTLDIWRMANVPTDSWSKHVQSFSS